MMKRKAILIFNDGGPTNYLSGVVNDCNGYLSFLKSPEGGAWKAEEIRVFYNDCSKDLLLCYINYNRLCFGIDYWLIVFSGHGYGREDNQTILELSTGNDCSVSEIKKATSNSCCLLIADSCRTVINEAKDRAIKKYSVTLDVKHDINYVIRCRNMYDKCLEGLCNCFNAIYAAEFNQAANEDESTGGYYSYALLDTARSLIISQKTSCPTTDYMSSIKNVHDKAKEKVLSLSSKTQTPSSHGPLLSCIPFIVVPRNEIQ